MCVLLSQTLLGNVPKGPYVSTKVMCLTCLNLRCNPYFSWQGLADYVAMLKVAGEVEGADFVNDEALRVSFTLTQADCGCVQMPQYDIIFVSFLYMASEGANKGNRENDSTTCISKTVLLYDVT